MLYYVAKHIIHRGYTMCSYIIWDNYDGMDVVIDNFKP
jgi:hypothetical protein